MRANYTRGIYCTYGISNAFSEINTRSINFSTAFVNFYTQFKHFTMFRLEISKSTKKREIMKIAARRWTEEKNGAHTRIRNEEEN